MAKLLKVLVAGLVAAVVVIGIALGIFYGAGEKDNNNGSDEIEPVLAENGIFLTLNGENIRLISGSIHYRRGSDHIC